MDKISISFVILALTLGLWIGGVAGSLLHRVFGLEILDVSLFGDSLNLISNFYLITRLEVRITPAAVLGFIITAILLYKKGKG